MADARVREMRPREVNGLLAQWNHCVRLDWRDEDGFRSTVLPPSGGGVALVAEDRREPIGFMSVTGGAITGFFTAEEHRRQGIATALLEAVLRHPACAGHTALTVASHNYWCCVPGIDSRYVDAITFLESRGFVRKGLNTDVSLSLDGFAALDRTRRPGNVQGLQILAWEPAMLDVMREFLRRLNMPGWIWPDWKDRYRRGTNGVRFVALHETGIVGWCDGTISPNGTAGINYIAVLANARHQGIGSALLREAVAGLAARGAKSFFAPYVPARFYLANGWRVCREYVVMARLR